jgi:hypothetical protein
MEKANRNALRLAFNRRIYHDVLNAVQSRICQGKRQPRLSPELMRLRQTWPIPGCNLNTTDPTALTVLRSFGPRLTKLVKADGSIIANDLARHHAAAVVDVSTQAKLIALLHTLERRPDCCIVSGAIAATANRERMRRLAFADQKADDPATLFDTPRAIWPLDVDSVAASQGLDLHDLHAAACVVREALPAAFHNVACVASATSGYMLKPGLRFRIWVRLSRPLTGAQMKLWLQRSGAPLDTAPLTACGVAYCAAPLFEVESRNPLPNGRLVVLDGDGCVTAPSDAELQPTVYARRSVVTMRGRSASSGGDALPSLHGAMIRIRRADVGDRHSVILKEALFLAGLVVAGCVPEDDARWGLTEAGAAIGKQESEIVRMFEWALAKVTDENWSEADQDKAARDFAEVTP